MTGPSPATVTFRMTARQRKIWLDQLLSPDTPVYNIGGATTIDGAVDVGVLRTAVDDVVRATDALWMQVTDVDGEPRIRLGERTPRLEVVDVSRDVDPERSAQEWMNRDFARLFQLHDAPLFRFGIVKVSADRFVWYQKYHHVIIDGWSAGLIIGRVAAAYAARLRGETPSRRLSVVSRHPF